MISRHIQINYYTVEKCRFINLTQCLLERYLSARLAECSPQITILLRKYNPRITQYSLLIGCRQYISGINNRST